MPAQIIQTMAFTQIMVIWTPWTTPRTTLNKVAGKTKTCIGTHHRWP